jgi:hypothetical protein
LWWSIGRIDRQCKNWFRYIGIAPGPLGAIAGTIPCDIIGALVGGLTGDKIGSRIDENSNKKQ